MTRTRPRTTNSTGHSTSIGRSLIAPQPDLPDRTRPPSTADHDGLPSFAMEFVEGGTLDTHLRKYSLK